MSWLRQWLGAVWKAPRSGQSMVEFALMVPILSLLVMGAVDFSMAVGRSAQLTSAVQEGTSYGRRFPNDAVNIRDHVKQEGPALGLTDANISITCYVGLSTTTKSCSTAVIGDSIRVQAIYNYTPITGRLASISGSPLAITQSAISEIY